MKKYGIDNFEDLDNMHLTIGEISGSEKQIAWVTDIVSGADAALAKGLETAKIRLETGTLDVEYVDAWLIAKHVYQNQLNKTASARDIIDTRGRYGYNAVQANASKLYHKIKGE